MLELDGIVMIRRPEGGRWNDGAAYWFGVRLRDASAEREYYEEAPVEEIQSYDRFQCFVAREFGLWFRYEPAEDPVHGRSAWSAHVESVWGRKSESADAGLPTYFDAAPWETDES
jgi:hypothetical protein